MQLPKPFSLSGHLSILNHPAVKILIFIAFFYLLLPNALFTYDYLCRGINAGRCLDPSWHISINLALQKKLTFGKDYAFIYGPLGFLATRAGLGISKFYFVVFDLFVLLNLAFILRYVFTRYYNVYVLLTLFLIIACTANQFTYKYNIVFLLLMISIFWLNYGLKYSSDWAFVISAAITVLLFFVKLNVSLIALFIFYVYLPFAFVSSKRGRFFKVGLAAATPLLIWVVSLFLKVDLVAYMKASYSFVNAYNDSMNYAPDGHVPALAGLIFILLFSSLFAINVTSLFSETRILLLAFTFALVSYVLFKQSFVRSDFMHYTAFMAFFPFLCGIIALFYDQASRHRTVIVLLVATFCFAYTVRIRNYSNPLRHLKYLNGVFLQSHQSEDEKNSAGLNASRRQLPDHVRNLIGNQSVDIFPYDICYLYFNHLNYEPRPIAQSYAAYDDYLMDLNRSKYESESGPDYVLFSNLAIDQRYPLSEDQKAKMALIEHYSCTTSFVADGKDFLLLSRKAQKSPLEFSPPVELNLKFDEDYALPDSSKIYYIKTEINYTAIGKLLRFAYQPFPVNIVFTLEDGTTRQHRVILPTLKSGLLINPYIETEQDFCQLVEGKFDAHMKKIRTFKFITKSNNAFGIYNDHIKLAVSECLIKK